MNIWGAIFLIFGVIYAILDQFHIGWYLDTGNKGLNLTIGWTGFVGGSIFLLFVIGRIFGFGEREAEETYQEDEYEDDEEIYQQTVKITWWNDWYDD